MAPGRGSIRVKVDPTASPHNQLQNLEESLEQMQHDFEAQLEEYEKTEQKLRRLKMNLLAADFTETFLHEDEEEGTGGDLKADLVNSEATITNGCENGSAVSPPPPDLVMSPSGRPVSQVVIESEVISPSKRHTHQPQVPGAPLSPDSAAREKMKMVWARITQLETLLEEYRSGLRVRMEKIKKTEDEIKTLSLCLNESRSPSRDKEFVRSSLLESVELNESLLVPVESEQEEAAEEKNSVGETNINPKDPEKSVDLNPEKEPLIRSSPSKKATTSTPNSDIQVAPPSPVSTMETCSQRDVEMSMTDDACMKQFKISRKSWILCAAVNVCVVFVVIGFMVLANGF